MAKSAVLTAGLALQIWTAGASNVHGVSSQRGHAFLSTKLMPEAVAQTLVAVEDEWQAQASLFASCSNSMQNDPDPLAHCAAAPQAFGKSCGTVVQAVLRGSAGDRDDVHEYLGEVCGQDVMKDWRQDRCKDLSESISQNMSPDDYNNRANVNISGICTNLWARVLSKNKMEQLRRAEEENKAANVAADKAEAEAKAKAKSEHDVEAKDKAAAAAAAAGGEIKVADEVALEWHQDHETMKSRFAELESQVGRLQKELQQAKGTVKARDAELATTKENYEKQVKTLTDKVGHQRKKK